MYEMTMFHVHISRFPQNESFRLAYRFLAESPHYASRGNRTAREWSRPGHFVVFFNLYFLICWHYHIFSFVCIFLMFLHIAWVDDADMFISTWTLIYLQQSSKWTMLERILGKHIRFTILRTIYEISYYYINIARIHMHKFSYKLFISNQVSKSISRTPFCFFM